MIILACGPASTISNGRWNDLSIGDLKYNAKVRLMSEPLTLDIYPWKRHSFHVSVGMLFNQNELRANQAVTSNSISKGTVGGIVSLHLKIQQQTVNPYLSIGGNFLYFDKAHHWGSGRRTGSGLYRQPNY